jgi:glycosyltransferase involved in cell wall biosynthesis
MVRQGAGSIRKYEDAAPGRYLFAGPSKKESFVMSKPTLSVIMSSYNYGQYIGEALEAIVSQSLRPFEVIVLDDASTDNSVEIIKEFARRDPIVKLVRNEQNLGVLEVMKLGISLATGEYLYGAAADDRVLPGFFEKSVNLLAQYQQAGLCSTDMGLFDEQGNITGEYRAAKIAESSFLSPEQVLGELYKDPQYIVGGTTIFRRSALEEAGGFPPQLLSLCDWFTERAIALRHGACYIPEVLFLWRRTDTNYSDACFRDAQGMLEVINQAVKLMRSPRYRDVFPPAFVQFWSKSYGDQVIDVAKRRLVQNRYAFMQDLNSCVKSSGIVNRLFLRILWFITEAALRFSDSSLKKPLRRIQTEIEQSD